MTINKLPLVVAFLTTVYGLILGGLVVDDAQHHSRDPQFGPSERASLQQWASNNKLPDGSAAVSVDGTGGTEGGTLQAATITIKGSPAHKDQSGTDIAATPDKQQNIYAVYDKDHVMIGVLSRA